MNDIGLRRLFRSPTEHLSVEEQLRLCPTRDLRKTKVFRTAAKIWGEPRRKRVIIAPPMLFCKDKEPKGKKSLFSGEEANDSDDPDVRDYREWMEKRKELRNGLDGFLLNENSLRMKSRKTELEKRVLKKMIEQKEKVRDKIKSEDNTDPSEVVTEIKESPKHKKRSHLQRPQLDLPVPEAMITINEFVEQNRLRLIDFFTQFDKDKDWYISETEFRKALCLANIRVPDQQLDNFISALDRDDNGLLDYRELVRGRKLLQLLSRAQKKEMQQKGDKSSVDETNSRSSTTGTSPASWTERISPFDNGRLSRQSPMSFLEVPRVSLTESVMDDQSSDLKAKVKAQKQKQQRAKQMKLRQGKADDARRSVVVPLRVERHLAPSTLSGSSGHLIDETRKQIKREYDKAVNLCRMHGVKLTRELLEKALLYPGDRSVKACKSGLQNIKSNCLSCNFAAMAEGDSSVDRRRLEFNLSNSSDTCLSTTPTPVKLVTGWAIVEPKTDCWLTELEFERLMRNLKRKSFSRLHPDRNAFWPGSMLDRLYLCMPHPLDAAPKKTVSVDNVFHPIVRPLTNRDSLRLHYLKSELWPVNDGGYIQHGSRPHRKQYQL